MLMKLTYLVLYEIDVTQSTGLNQNTGTNGESGTSHFCFLVIPALIPGAQIDFKENLGDLDREPHLKS